eukprot:scaffold178660_cov35-Attheya_sp.AAC.1
MSSVLIPQPSYHERSDNGAQLCSFILPHSHSYRGQSRRLENGDTWVKSVPFDCYAWRRVQGNIRHYACNTVRENQNHVMALQHILPLCVMLRRTGPREHIELQYGMVGYAGPKYNFQAYVLLPNDILSWPSCPVRRVETIVK